MQPPEKTLKEYICTAQPAGTQRSGQNLILKDHFLAKAGPSRKIARKNRACSESAARDLQMLACAVSRAAEAQKVVLTTGIGLSDKGVPLRLPALIVPGLNMMRELVKTGNADIRYIVYQARDFITETNGLDAAMAFGNAALCTGYIRRFVDEFFPDVADRVTILSGDDFRLGRAHLSTLADRLAGAEDGPVRENMAAIESYASRRRGAARSHLYYAAANIILNGGYGPHYPLRDHVRDDDAVIIPLGGAKEKPFFNLTSLIGAETECRHKIIPVIVPVGGIPAYYPNPRADLLLGRDGGDEDFVPPPEIENDFALLENMGITVGMLGKMALSL